MATKATKKKNPAAVALGRLRAKTANPEDLAAWGRVGGLKGGAARAASLSKKRRSEIARAAAAARWATKKK
jgi:hypothetical protein